MTERLLHAVPDPPDGSEPSEPLMRELIGAVLRRARTDQDRTLREVAESAQISLPYLSEIERGRKEPSSEVLAAVCRALGLRLTDLLDVLHTRLTLDYRSAGAQPRWPVSPGNGPQAMMLAA